MYREENETLECSNKNSLSEIRRHQESKNSVSFPFSRLKELNITPLSCLYKSDNLDYFKNVTHLFGFRRCPGHVFMVRVVMAVLAEDGLEVLLILSQSLHLKRKG
jgi:hypothetical protein